MEKAFKADLKLLTLSLALLFACQSSRIDTKPAEDESEIKSLAELAESKFALSPRSADTVLEAYELMKSAAEQSSKRNPNRYGFHVRAARFAIWLSYHLDNKSDKTKLANSAISLCQKAIDLDKTRVEAFYYRAVAVGLFARLNKLYARNSMSQIRRDLMIAIDIEPAFDYGGPHRILGALYLRAPGPPAGIGSKRRATFHLEAAFKISQDYPENLLFLAEAYALEGKLKEVNQLLRTLRSSILKFGDETDQEDWLTRKARLEEKFKKSK